MQQNHEVIYISGRYRNIVTTLSNKFLKAIKKDFTGKKTNKLENRWFLEVINESIPLRFYVGMQIQWCNQFYVSGNAYNPTEPVSDKIPYVEITVKLDPKSIPNIYSKVAIMVRNSFRHELEHLTQCGYNTLPGKYLPDDQEERKNLKTYADYFLLAKEIPAMIHGLQFQASKQKRGLQEVFLEYLHTCPSSQYLLKKDVDNIMDIWVKEAKQKNLIDRKGYGRNDNM